MIQVEVWGDYALFSRPELKVERMSYDVMTPSAARGILEAVYWHPGMKWVIERIHVLAPIRFTSVRRNEVLSPISAQNVRTAMTGGKKDLYLSTPDEIVQRASLLLQDVRYVIDAHFDLTPQANPGDNAGKFQDIMKRRLEKGACYTQPYLGCREFPAGFRRWPGGPVPTHPSLAGERDLGLMLHDMDYSNPQDIQPVFFRAVLRDGVLEAAGQEVHR